MSELAEIYKQAHTDVLNKYQKNPEERWRIEAIANHRSGKVKHNSVMYDLVQDVEAAVNKAIVNQPAIPTTVKPSTGPKVKAEKI